MSTTMPANRPFSIRAADVADAPALAELGRQTFLETFAAHNDPADMAAYLAGAYTVDRLIAELSEPGSIYLVAEGPAGVIGFARVARGTPPAGVTGPAPVRLAKLYVVAAALGTGVGAALMRSSLDWACDSGYKTVWLGVWEHNHRALAFYERWGFVPVGTESFLLGQDLQTDLVLQRLDPASG